MPKWWLEQKDDVAQAINVAESTSGHQIIVHVGNLGRHPDKMANRFARKWPQASLIFCVDPKHRHFEIRWSSAIQLDDVHVTEAVRAPLREHNLARAITELAALLPQQREGQELPDIVDESDSGS